jgi:hypothetical protein
VPYNGKVVEYKKKKKKVIENSFESKLSIIGECGHAQDIFRKSSTRRI